MIVGEKKHSAYIGACAQRGWKSVLPTDRQDLLDYLQGNIESSSHLIEISQDEIMGDQGIEDIEDIQDSKEKADERASYKQMNAQENWAGPLYSGKAGNLFWAPGADFSIGYDMWKKARKDLVQKERQIEKSLEKEAQEQNHQNSIPNNEEEIVQATTKDVELIEKNSEKNTSQNKRSANEQDNTFSEIHAPPEKIQKIEDKIRSSSAKDLKSVKRDPYIIIVPSATTSVLTLLNAADFMMDGKFIPTDEKKAAGIKRETSIIIEKQRSDGLMQPYRIIDNPIKLSPKEFDRIVAVFAMGPTWQFKGWRISEPVELFQRVLGIHLQFDDELTPTNITQWNVRILKLSKTKRHLDASLVLDFWRSLEDHIQKIKAKHATTKKISHSSSVQKHHRSHHQSIASAEKKKRAHQRTHHPSSSAKAAVHRASNGAPTENR
eukprot:CAMPEP_0197322050 /NCGR_PEP_ID=MMETSP0891-20130614/67893_1 /TAXON_ID=44058 ORGANISM="Aureoumbra lagunensis, Strain CCMP1510" /NCGR_SAMPLE_ID=MMETSP0891 /ASSEMBLY_ACC=CAM_ASM_000534 /LENGTH=434 /DNA_ID=CAMNT_0042814257 /DNA_START=186 /DNA_END=1490 /DNA_ORIENTATION=+